MNLFFVKKEVNIPSNLLVFLLFFVTFFFIGVSVVYAAPNIRDTNCVTSDLNATCSAVVDNCSPTTHCDYEWYWGDGNRSTGLPASNLYSSGGAYRVDLVVTDNIPPDLGTTDTASVNINVQEPNISPTADFSCSPRSNDGNVIECDASASTDEDGNDDNLSYSWNFGDGSTGGGETPSHEYSSGGTYTVTLTVTDEDGLTGTNDATVSVIKSNFTADTTDLRVDVTQSASGPVDSYSWSYGDGASGSGPSDSHTYSSGGGYDITLTVSGNGVSDSSTKPVTVTEPTPTNTPPNADFTINPNPVAEGDTFTLDASPSSDAEDSDSQLTYEWDFASDDFGGGVDATGMVVTNSVNNFPADGTRAMTLTVTDTGGLSDSITKQVQEATGGGCVDTDGDGICDSSDFCPSLPEDFDGYNDGDGCPETNPTVSATIGISDLDNTITEGDTTTLTWNSSNADSCTGTNFNTGGGLDGNVDVSPTSNTTYTVECSNSAGDTASDQVTLTVNEPSAPPVTVTVTTPDNTIDEGDNTRIEWSSSGADSCTGSDVGLSVNALTGDDLVSPSSDETYRVTCTNSSGGSDFDEVTIFVTQNDPPNADFSYSGPGQTISFDANGPDSPQSSDPDGDSLSYSWQFGDGDTGSGPEPSHIYDSGGEYDVTLTVDDGNGGTDSITKVIDVNANPIASFTIEKISETTRFFDGSDSEDPDGTIATEDYEWDFDDGDTDSGIIDPSHSYLNGGTYEVTLTVTDNEGATGQAQKQVNIPNQSNITFDTDVDGADVEFNATASDGGNKVIDTYEWDFGNGESGSGVVTTHTYDEDGRYTVTLTVTFGDGSTESVRDEVFINTGTYDPGPRDSSGTGLIPCDGLDCDFSKLIELFKNVIDWISSIMVLIAMIMYAYAGFLFLTSRGDSGKRNRAKDILRKVTYGVVIVLTAWLIVNTILTALGVDDAFILLG